MKAKNILLIVVILGLMPFRILAGFEVVGSLTNKYVAQKGEKYSATLKVRNIGDTEQEVKLYLRDYVFDYQGASLYNEPGTLKRSNATWIQYSPKTIFLKGNEIKDVLLEINVPQGDSLSGTYWSVLMVEGVGQIDPSSKGQLSINESVRYAVQIITNIGKTGTGQLEFENPGIVTDNNKTYFDFVLINTGERLISPDVSMELFDETTGNSLKLLKAPKNGMYPTTSTKWRFSMDGIPTGKNYKAIIVADGTGEDVFGLEYTIAL